jgi:hypothetical protein
LCATSYLDDFVAFASRDGRLASLQELSPALGRRWLLATQSTIGLVVLSQRASLG